MNPHASYPWRLRAYERLCRILRFRSYGGKIFILTFGAAHIPLLTLAAYLLVISSLSTSTIWSLLVVALIATLVGTGLAMIGLWVLLAPVTATSQALVLYRESGARSRLPLDLPDEGGRLLSDVQATLDHLDDVIGDLRDAASRDVLTGVYNRREGHSRLANSISARKSEGARLVLVMIDADDLKWINDTWGHTAGDSALLHLSTTMTQHLRPGDWIARWGGDEFILAFQDETELAEAELRVEQICSHLADTPVTLASGAHFVMQVSAGIARAEQDDDARTLFQRADEMLYLAKQSKFTRQA